MCIANVTMTAVNVGNIGHSRVMIVVGITLGIVE